MKKEIVLAIILLTDRLERARKITQHLKIFINHDADGQELVINFTFDFGNGEYSEAARCDVRDQDNDVNGEYKSLLEAVDLIIARAEAIDQAKS